MPLKFLEGIDWDDERKRALATPGARHSGEGASKSPFVKGLRMELRNSETLFVFDVEVDRRDVALDAKARRVMLNGAELQSPRMTVIPRSEISIVRVEGTIAPEHMYLAQSRSLELVVVFGDEGGPERTLSAFTVRSL